ncbi:hypothetical protein [Endozoicomonas sp. YOMI1]|uniref:hypothetical protein n=1 Tax=Endozoicomonas sp. YOMI1 TaxID=2828739 RepID=UPI00214742C3|nr:hypothetical protein [Endozoicomonas sp. YOMI1]
MNSRVETKGEFAYAGIGGGRVYHGGTVAHTTAVDSYVSGFKKNFGSISNDQLLCQKADLRVLTANCSLRTEFLDALDVSYSDACPGNAATATTTATVPTVATRRGAVVANTTQVNSFARSTGYSSGVAREPLPASPAPTVANSTMNLSDLPGATMTLPTTAAPLAATLSSGAVAGIAVGTAAFAVAGVVLGRYIYRRYCRGSSAADDPQEMVAINTVGQAQKARTQTTIKEAREKPADVQRPRRPAPELPGLQQPALPEKPPIRPRDSFFEELRG